MIASVLLAVGLCAALWYGVREVRSWSAPATRGLLSPRQHRIRSWGFFFLFALLGMSLLGSLLPTPQTHGKHPTAAMRRQTGRYAAYWMLTTLLAVPLIPLALMDARENMKRLALETRGLAQEYQELKRLKNAIEMVSDDSERL